MQDQMGPEDSIATACENRLQIVQGYYELGMYDESRQELEEVEEVFPQHPEVVQMRILLLLKDRLWEEAFELSEQLRAAEPEGSAGYIHGAYCLHEMDRTDEALSLLAKGPSALREEAIYYYNMGCYQAAVGAVKDAQDCLRRSFNLDGRLMDIARKDPDLEGLHDLLY